MHACRACFLLREGEGPTCRHVGDKQVSGSNKELVYVSWFHNMAACLYKVHIWKQPIKVSLAIELLYSL